jgi:hypothetical protein
MVWYYPPPATLALGPDNRMEVGTMNDGIVTADCSPNVARRLALARELEETLTMTAPETVAALDEFLAPVQTPEERPVVGLSLELYRRKLAWVRDNLTAAEQRYVEGLARAAALFTLRDALTVELSKKLGNLQRTCRAWLDADDLRLLGFAARTARWPKPVLKQSREVATGLERLDVEIDSPEWPKLKAWLRDQARALVPEITELSRALADVEQQRRRTKDDLAARKEASEDFDRNYLAIGRVAEALLRMAGKDADADRIHPSTRQLDRKMDEEEVDAGSTDTWSS